MVEIDELKYESTDEDGNESWWSLSSRPDLVVFSSSRRESDIEIKGKAAFFANLAVACVAMFMFAAALAIAFSIPWLVMESLIMLLGG